MSDGAAASAVAPAPSAAPAAVARVNVQPTIKTPPDPFDAAKAEWNARKKAQSHLRLAEKDEKPATPEESAELDTVDETNSISEDGTDDVEELDAVEDETAEPADEEKPHWAKKLKAEHAEATKKVAEYAEREKRWQGAVQQIKHQHQDVTDEVTFWKDTAAAIEGVLNKKGFSLDPVAWEKMQAQHEVKKLKRQLERGRGSTVDTEASKHGDMLRGRFAALMQKFPEADPKKNPAAREFVEDALARWTRTGSVEFLEDAAERFVLGHRAKLAAKNAPKKSAIPQKPKQTTLTSKRSTLPAPVKGDPLSNKSLKAELASFRASRR